MFKLKGLSRSSITSFSKRSSYALRQRNKHSVSINPRKDSKEIKLKYDLLDTSRPNNFTTYGILPFLQTKLNDYFVPDGNYNVSPTHDQKLITTVLNSQHSIIQKSSESGTGKSLAIATYAVNFSLTRFPNFGILSHKKLVVNSVDSVILVPSDSMVAKYKQYIDLLSKDMPYDCCPDRFFDGEFTRRPFKIEYYTEKGSKCSLTKTTPEKAAAATSVAKECIRVPHILVTTPNGLHEIMEGKSSSLTKLNNLLDLRFFAVDGLDFMINCTDVAGSQNFTTSGKKNRIVHKVEKIIKDLQNLQVDQYVSSLTSRLSHVEKKFKQLNQQESDLVDYTSIVLRDNSMSISDVEKYVGESHDKINGSLLKKLIKAKRQVFYKPIQYCFIIEAKEHFYQTLMRLNTRNQKDLILQTIFQQQEQIQNSKPGVDLDFQTNYNRYLDEKGTTIAHQRDQVDLQVAYIEKLIRFDDTKRFYRNQERKVLTVGSPTLPAKECLVNMSFVETTTKKLIIDINVLSQLPSNAKAVRQFIADSDLTNTNMINFHKQYLKQKFATKMYALLNESKKKSLLELYKTTIKSTIKLFREENPLNISPFLVVIPPYLDVTSFNTGNERFHVARKTTNIEAFFKVKPAENKSINNLIVQPSEMISQEFSSLENIAIFGMESLLPQLAMSSWESASALSVLPGIKDPIADLFTFYLSKLQKNTRSTEKHMIFNIVEGNLLDYQRLSNIILYNNIKERVNIIQLGEKSPSKCLHYQLTKEMVLKNDKLSKNRVADLSNILKGNPKNKPDVQSSEKVGKNEKDTPCTY